MKKRYILLTLGCSLYANLDLLSTTQKNTLVNFINTKSEYIETNTSTIRDNNETNITTTHLATLKSLKIKDYNLNYLIDELGYINNLETFYFHKTNLIDNQLPNSFYRLNITKSTTSSGSSHTKNSSETTNEFLNRLNWNRKNNQPIVNTSKEYIYIKKYEYIDIEGNATDSDGVVKKISWNFSDGSSSSSAKPIKTFSNGGNYSATFTATDDDGNSTKKVIPIYVNDSDIKTYKEYPYSETNSFKVNQKVFFEPYYVDNNKYSYSWDLNNSTSTETTSSTIFQKTGNHKITLSTTNKTTKEIIKSSKNIVINNSSTYNTMIDELNKNLFETQSEWINRINNYTKTIQRDIVFKNYSADNEEVTFNYNLRELFINTDEQTQKMDLQEAKLLFDINETEKINIELKANLNGENITIYPNQFYFDNLSKSCSYYTSSKLNDLKTELNKAIYENTQSHIDLIKTFNNRNEKHCFPLTFSSYDAENGKMYVTLDLSSLSLTNKDIVIDINSSDRGENINYFKEYMNLESSFDIIYKNSEYFPYFERDYSKINPFDFYDDLDFIYFNYQAGVMDSIKSELQKSDYEEELSYKQRLSKYKPKFVVDISNQFTYNFFLKRLSFTLDLSKLNLANESYYIDNIEQNLAEKIHENAEIIIELYMYDEGSEIKYYTNDIYVNLDGIEYTAQKSSTTTPSEALIIKSGWNLLSTPVASKLDSSILNSNQIWIYKNKTWIKNPNEIEPLYGFWLKANENKTLNLTGSSYSLDVSILDNGWNLTGTGENLTNLNQYDVNNFYIYRDNKWLDLKSNTLSEIKKGEGVWVNK